MAEVLPVLFALIGVLALMLLVVWIMKWITGRFGGQRGMGRAIRISDCISVGQDKTIMAVRAGNKSLLLGVTSSQISLICELDEADMELIEKSKQASAADMAGRSFAECLKYNIQKKGADFIRPGCTDADPSQDGEEDFHEKG
ncbi:MAG: flagellar biosynthetic protein FliO [Huintestinicola sp.]